MNEQYGITAENLLRSLPDVLSRDKSMYALASSIAKVLSARPDEIEALIIYNRIDRLPEPLLDILAHDFKVDWWDPEYQIEEKRRTLRDSWHVHRKLGTKYAVETALGNVFPGTRVEEWFEYGGQPYFFRVIIGATSAGVSAERQAAVLDRVQFYKNLRSHLETISYQIEKKGTVTVAGYSTIGQRIEVYPHREQEA